MTITPFTITERVRTAGPTEHIMFTMNLSSWRGNDDEPWRNTRLHRVAERLGKFPMVAIHIEQLHDHKGSLFYRLNDTVKVADVEKVRTLIGWAWDEEYEEGSSIEEMTDLTYNPHPQLSYSFAVDPDFLRQIERLLND